MKMKVMATRVIQAIIMKKSMKGKMRPGEADKWVVAITAAREVTRATARNTRAATTGKDRKVAIRDTRELKVATGKDLKEGTGNKAAGRVEAIIKTGANGADKTRDMEDIQARVQIQDGAARKAVIRVKKKWEAAAAPGIPMEKIMKTTR
jgi:hypothetical protein